MACRADVVVDMVYALGLQAGNKLPNRLLTLTMRTALYLLRPAPSSLSRMSAFTSTWVHTGVLKRETQK